jgi:hypothetical protein
MGGNVMSYHATGGSALPALLLPPPPPLPPLLLGPENMFVALGGKL